MTEEKEITLAEANEMIQFFEDTPLDREKLAGSLNFMIMYSGRKINDTAIPEARRLAWGRLNTRYMSIACTLLKDSQLDRLERRLKALEEAKK